MPHAQLPSLPPCRQPRWLLVLMFIAHATPLSIATVIFLQTMFPDAGLFFQALTVALIIATVVVAVGRLARSVTSAKPVVSKWPRKMGWITWTFTMSVACVVTSAVCASSSPDGEYEYATVSSSALSTDQLHMFIGAFDGNGKVRLWLDASDSGVSESGSLSEGVDTNDVPIRLGADPEGASGSRYHFDGAVQMISIHKWRNH